MIVVFVLLLRLVCWSFLCDGLACLVYFVFLSVGDVLWSGVSFGLLRVVFAFVVCGVGLALS